MKRLLLRGGAAVALFAMLALWRAGDRYAVFPNPLTFDLTLEPGAAGRADPVIVSGITGAGDFLTVRFDDPRTVRFIYDSWGFPGLVSEPITVEPGVPLRLTVTMPALTLLRGTLSAGSDRVKVVCNDRNLLDVTGHSYAREPEQIHFGQNQIGGTSCGPILHGRVTALDGGAIRGDALAALPLTVRLRDWTAHYPHQVATTALISLAVALFGGKLRRLPTAVGAGFRVMVRHRWFVGSAAVATLGYAWLVTLGSFQLKYPEIFGDFYDFQAASLLSGRLDVPEEAIGGEAFEARGKLYGYFGPTPAVLRTPLVLLGVGFGRYCRAFMLVYFVACLVAAYLLLREALRATRGSDHADDNPPSPWATVVLVGSVGWGSTIFFLGCRGIVFHEAILSGIAFALWSTWCSLRHLREPAGRWWIGALVCGIASVHCRPPTGLFALTLLGCVGIAVWLRAGSVRWTALHLRRALILGSLCALGQLSLNGLAWLKFRTFDPAPLAISRPYKDPGRLERIDSKSFHAANVPFGFYTYFVRPNLRLEPGFPWIYWGAREPGREFPKAKIDLPDHTLAAPYAMPSLFALATLGSVAAFLFRPRTRPAIAVLWLAVLPMSLALFAAVATAQRYTGDFCPLLIAGAAFGLATIDTAAARGLAAVRTLIVLLMLAAIAVTVAITIQYQGDYLWGVPDEVKQNYQALRQRVDAFFR